MIGHARKFVESILVKQTFENDLIGSLGFDKTK